MTQPPQPAKLKAALNRGEGRDKVAVNDPAAAPLGTDEEAAGTPVPSDAVQSAMNHESRGSPRPVREGHEPLFPTRAALVASGLLLIAAAIAAAYISR